MSAATAIELVGVVRTFEDVTALDGLDLQVASGEVVGLLGHNGAGKTTTVRVVAGLLPADRGTVRVDGMDPMVDGTAVRRRVGVLPARPVVDTRLTARGNLRFAAEVFDLPTAGLADRIDGALHAFQLDERSEDRVEGFSTGMRQRLSLARVLLPDPSILLLDEPTSALDPVAARQVRDLLARLAREEQRTIVVCTHDLPEAEQLCDRVVVLEDGRVVAQGRPAELAAEHGRTGLRLEVPPDRQAEAVAIVGEVVGTAPVIDHAGHVLMRPIAADQVPAVVRALVAADVDVLEARRLVGSLEDVYLALHDQGHGRRPIPTGGEAHP